MSEEETMKKCSSPKASIIEGYTTTKTIKAAENTARRETSCNSTVSEMHQPQDQERDFKAAVAGSVVMRRLAPVLATAEVRSARLVSKATNKALAATGKILVHLGAACLRSSNLQQR
jgi:hypothetical protein